MNNTNKSDVKNCSLREKNILNMHHYNPLLNTNYTYRQNFPKNLVENKEMVLKNEVIDIQTSGYNGAHTEVRNI